MTTHREEIKKTTACTYITNSYWSIYLMIEIILQNNDDIRQTNRNRTGLFKGALATILTKKLYALEIGK